MEVYVKKTKTMSFSKSGNMPCVTFWRCADICCFRSASGGSRP